MAPQQMQTDRNLLNPTNRNQVGPDVTINRARGDGEVVGLLAAAVVGQQSAPTISEIHGKEPFNMAKVNDYSNQP